MSVKPIGAKPNGRIGFINHFPYPDESVHLALETDVLYGTPPAEDNVSV